MDCLTKAEWWWPAIADGSTIAKTFAEPGITEINLKSDATRIMQWDGSHGSEQDFCIGQ